MKILVMLLTFILAFNSFALAQMDICQNAKLLSSASMDEDCPHSSESEKSNAQEDSNENTCLHCLSHCTNQLMYFGFLLSIDFLVTDSTYLQFYSFVFDPLYLDAPFRPPLV